MINSKIMWNGKKCELQAWSDIRHELIDDSFPWLAYEKKTGLLIVVSDWTLDDDGEWDCWEIGVKWDDLINWFIEIEDCCDEEEKAERRALTIATLERTIERLKGSLL